MITDNVSVLICENASSNRKSAIICAFAKDLLYYERETMTAFRRFTSKQLGELLLERGIISQKQLNHALEVQRERGGLIGEVLVELGYAKEEQIAQALTTQYGFPYLPLGNYDIDPEVIKLIPENVAKQYCLIPIDKIGNGLTIAMSNPLNIQAIEDVELVSRCTVQAFVSTTTDIREAIKRYYK